MSPLAFFNDQAAKQTFAGDQAELQNARERCQRAAAAAWSVLAAREKRSDDAREKRRLETVDAATPKPEQPARSADLG